MNKAERLAKAAEICKYLRSGETDYKGIAEVVGCDLSTVYAYRAMIFPELKRKRRSNRRVVPKQVEKLLTAEFSDNNSTVTFVPSGETTESFLDAMEAPVEAPIADNVNNPAHYTVGGISTYDFIRAKDLSYDLGNVVKYVSRAKHKGNTLEDLKKAQWYLAAAIKHEEQVNG